MPISKGLKRTSKTPTDLPTLLPWSKFDWKAYRADAGLLSCSLAAQGAWMRLLCLASDGEPFGHVTINGRCASTKQIAGYLGIQPDEAASLLEELEEAGVFSRRSTLRLEADRQMIETLRQLEAEKVFVDVDSETIFCRRMIRDLFEYRANVTNGRKGGNPNLANLPPIKGGDGGDNGGDKAKDVEELEEEVPEPSVQGADAPVGAADLFGHEPTPSKPKPSEHPIRTEGIELLSWIAKETDSAKLHRLLNSCVKACKENRDLLLEALRETHAKPADKANIGTLKLIIAEKMEPPKGKPRVVVDNTSKQAKPEDDVVRIINEWCSRLPGVKPTKSAGDREKGAWDYNGDIIDKRVRDVLAASGFVPKRPQDLDPIQAWSDADVDSAKAYELIEETVESHARKGGGPIYSLKFFNSLFPSGRAA